MSMPPLKIGFIGLGIMGAPMAGHLAAAGHHSGRVKALEKLANFEIGQSAPAAA